MAKYILGFAFGVLVVLVVIFLLPSINYTVNPYTQIAEPDSLRTKDTIIGLNKDDFLLYVGVSEEKIASLNTRFNDLYILGSIIVMLLVAIVASIYIKTESDVKKHLMDNFEKNKDQILKYVTEAEQMLEKGKTEFELMAHLRKSMQETIQKEIPRTESTEQHT
jgi:uncharacterized membrane protein SpoIIM required for sporulation